jgi:hypothetical protein
VKLRGSCSLPIVYDVFRGLLMTIRAEELCILIGKLNVILGEVSIR